MAARYDDNENIAAIKWRNVAAMKWNNIGNGVAGS